MTIPTAQEELILLKKYRFVAGVDEAGRGPLAGPVVAAAVILDLEALAENAIFKTINDSKKLNERNRDELAPLIKSNAISWGVGLSTPREIDEMNIHHASLLAMRRATEACSLPPEALLVDGRFTIPDLALHQKSIISGDSLSVSIAAASIVAKVTRDGIMKKYHKTYPQYGFGQHKGYPTASHRAAITAFGLSPIHRASFCKS